MPSPRRSRARTRAHQLCLVALKVVPFIPQSLCSLGREWRLTPSGDQTDTVFLTCCAQECVEEPVRA